MTGVGAQNKRIRPSLFFRFDMEIIDSARAGLLASFQLRRALQPVAANDASGRIIRAHLLFSAALNAALALVGMALEAEDPADIDEWLSSRYGWNRSIAGHAFDVARTCAEVTAYTITVGLSALWAGAIAKHAAAWRKGVLRTCHASSNSSEEQKQLHTTASPGGSSGIIRSASEALLGVLLLALMNVATLLVDALPIVGRPAALCLAAFLYSFSAHSAVQGSGASSLAQRIHGAEHAWAYHVGFGMVAATQTFSYGWLLNGAVYGAAYPWLCLLAAAGRNPVPSRLRLPVLWPFEVASVWFIQAVHLFAELLTRVRSARCCRKRAG